MKIFNFIKDEVCVPIAAHNLQEAQESFFKTEGYKIEVDKLRSPDDDKDQYKLYDMKKLEQEWNEVEEGEPI